MIKPDFYPGDIIQYTTPDGDRRLGIVDSVSPWTGRITVEIQGTYATDGSLDTSVPAGLGEDAFVPGDAENVKVLWND